MENECISFGNDFIIIAAGDTSIFNFQFSILNSTVPVDCEKITCGKIDINFNFFPAVEKL